jgi:hypothetical protein
LCADEKLSAFVELERQVLTVTFYLESQSRACFRSGEIHVLDSTGKLERTIPFSEADRKL